MPNHRAAYGVYLMLAASLFAGACASCKTPDLERRGGPPAPEKVEAIAWIDWSDEAFARARRENRLVLLDLGAVWCHWCHVMDRETYADPGVAALLRARYVAVRVDQDARPDISRRYEEYGWPATIIFGPDGAELVKRRGFLPPREMRALLQAVLDDPTPGPSVTTERPVLPAESPFLSDALRTELRRRYVDGYDREQQGWGTIQKFLDWDCVEYGLERGREGDAEAERMARATVDAQLALVDPVWGGVYQYSHGGVWTNPHFEKIMQMQAENLRIFSLAHSRWGDPRHLAAARTIAGYLDHFLTSPDGAFYVSQDADVVQGEHAAGYFALEDRGRRALGLPRVDTHVYARENGWAIAGLAAFCKATGDAPALAAATRAAKWVLAHRALAGGGFRHDEQDAAGPYLGDTLAMARAFVELYEATADRPWLARAREALGFLDANFKSTAGFVAARVPPGAEGKPWAPRPQVEENVALARLAIRLAHLAGEPLGRALAEHAMRYLAAPEVGESRGYGVAGILLADRELGGDPIELTVVGPKGDDRAKALFAAAIRFPSGYTCVRWQDDREGPLPGLDTPYAAKDRPVAYVCARGACSTPIDDPTKLLLVAEEMVRR
ncbi:MAG: thioredoxin domain-containing protein [Planctomycetes bacterium]|nr:thioredoxin domain-containing protein [Planctomycetota bacterium]